MLTACIVYLAQFLSKKTSATYTSVVAHDTADMQLNLRDRLCPNSYILSTLIAHEYSLLGGVTQLMKQHDNVVENDKCNASAGEKNYFEFTSNLIIVTTCIQCCIHHHTHLVLFPHESL